MHLAAIIPAALNDQLETFTLARNEFEKSLKNPQRIARIIKRGTFPSEWIS